ncbi:MAG: histidine phosphatase family protein [Clostridia bacterium]|nr:histidine phosphatase family protein [Clostridia bacterium]
MTEIYIVRHCEAKGNHKRLFQGSTDCDITELGERQLEFLRERFKSVRLDRIYTSPLIRAKKTAEAIRGERDIEIIPVEGLTEVHGGVLEGKPFLEMFKRTPELGRIWNDNPQDFEPEGGEAMRHAYERICRAVINITNENKGKTVAIATHGGVTRCLMCRLMYGSIDRLKDVEWCENTAVSLIRFDDDLNAQLVYMNDHSHIPEELLPKRSRIAEVSKD